MREHKVKVYQFSELDDTAKEKAISWAREITIDDKHYAEDEGLIYSKKHNFDGTEILSGLIPTYWNVGYGHNYIQFKKLEIGDEKLFLKKLKIPKRLADKLTYYFADNNGKESNTTIVFQLLNTVTIDLDDDYANIEQYKGEISIPTEKEFEILYKAKEIFDEVMDSALDNLRSSFEYQFSDKGLQEFIEMNEYEFTKDGTRFVY